MRVLLAIALALSLPAVAQDRTIEQVEAEREAALAEQTRLAAERAGVERQLEALKAEMTQVGAEAASLEAQEAELGARVEALSATAEELESKVVGDRKDLARLVATLQRIEANPPPAIVGGGESAIASARAARLTGTVARSLKARTDQIAQDLAELEDVQVQLGEEQAKLTEKREALSERRAQLRGLAKEKGELSAKLGAEAEAQAQRAEQLAKEADTLRELVASLEAAAKAEPRVKPQVRRPESPGEVRPRLKPRAGETYTPRPLPEGLRFADARGQLGLPVQGRIGARFGGASKGVSVLAAGGAQVSSPYGGRVEFAGPFKNYEQLVILNAGDGYFVVLSGMGETYVGSGETVGVGEPVGAMPRGSGGELYIEFRKDGRTIDPGPWLAVG